MVDRCNDARIQAWRSLVRAHSVLSEALEQALAEHADIPLISYELLAHLADADEGRLRMQEIAGLLPLTKSGLTRLVDRLESSGLVARESCPTDGRGTFAAITDDGRRALDEAGGPHLEVLEHYLDGPLTDEQLRSLQRACERIAGAVERASLPA